MRVFFPICFLILLSSCSSSRLVEQYSNPETPDFKPQKMLVVGLTPDGGLQRQFEFSMVKALGDHHVNAVKSVDLYGEPFRISEDSDGQLEIFESELIKAGFDAVLFSKITGQESRVTLAQSYRNLVRTFDTFGDYYKENRNIQENGRLEDYPVLTTETSLYCLCPDRKNDLIWRGSIDIVNAPNSQETIRDYIKVLKKALRRKGFLD